ncbi:MAG: glycosyltransferase family 4 protein [Chlorobia bacterium]|nr:glycosyltransferase family 4 protein [Fimbriimonadaceae bacterium]
MTRLAPVIWLGKSKAGPKARKWLAYADKYILFPKVIRRAKRDADVVHILDHGNAMYVPHVADVPHLITCHDLLALRAAEGDIPGWDVGATGRKYQSLIKSGLQKAFSIAAVSEATKQDTIRVLGVPEEKVVLVYNGQYQVLQASGAEKLDEFRSAYGLHGAYYLHVGNDSPYKNRLGLIDIYKELLAQLGDQCPNLVLAGKLPDSRTTIAISGLPKDKVKLVPFPEPGDLARLYQSATALIFPSTFEGFGLPILEAMSLSCPVYTSDRAPMTEVGGNAAVYFPPDNPREAVSRISCSQNYQQMRQEGLVQASKFSTEQMINGYVQLYQHCRNR